MNRVLFLLDEIGGKHAPIHTCILVPQDGMYTYRLQSNLVANLSASLFFGSTLLSKFALPFGYALPSKPLIILTKTKVRFTLLVLTPFLKVNPLFCSFSLCYVGLTIVSNFDWRVLSIFSSFFSSVFCYLLLYNPLLLVFSPYFIHPKIHLKNLLNIHVSLMYPFSSLLWIWIPILWYYCHKDIGFQLVCIDQHGVVIKPIHID
jgi:hypothetical protein